MSISIAEIAQRVGGTLFGAGEPPIENALPLQDASRGHITLLDDAKHVARFVESEAEAAIVPLEKAESIFQAAGKPIIGVSDIHQAFIEIIQTLRVTKQQNYFGIDNRAVVHATVTCGENVYIGAGATIGPTCHIGDNCRIHAGVHLMKGCRLGNDCEIFPGTVLYPDTILGDRVILHANVVIGAYGFGYRLKDGQHHRTAQLGWVEIENDVEIGAASTIDRGTYGPTRIGLGTKIDNQVQIGHNTHIGQHNLMCSQVGIAGSCSTGDYVVFGGQVGVRDHVHIADRVMVSAQSGIANNVKDGEILLGTPALPQREAAQIFFASKRLPELVKEVRELRAMIKKIEAAALQTDTPVLRTVKAA